MENPTKPWLLKRQAYPRYSEVEIVGEYDTFEAAYEDEDKLSKQNLIDFRNTKDDHCYYWVSTNSKEVVDE